MAIERLTVEVPIRIPRVEVKNHIQISPLEYARCQGESCSWELSNEE